MYVITNSRRSSGMGIYHGHHNQANMVTSVCPHRSYLCCFVLGITHPEVTVQFDGKIYDGFVVVHEFPRGNLQRPLTISV